MKSIPSALAPIPVAIYSRVSTQKQLGRRVESCESQEAICRDHIEAQAPVKKWRLARTFTDPAYSGATMRRPGMDALKRAVMAGEIKVVVIFKLERVLRSTDEWAPFRTFLHEHGCELASAMEDISEATALGRLKNNLLVSVSEYDRLNIAEKVRAKMGEQAKRGYWNGGSIPYGYAYDKNTQTLSVHSEEGPVVQRIYADAAKLISLTDLANTLYAEGFRTKPRYWKRRDGSREAIGERRFRSDGLRLLITNPMYRGAVRFAGKEYPSQHPALVAAELWEKANVAVKETRGRPELRLNSNRHQYLLKGICRCGHCGCALIPQTGGLSNNANKRYRYYTCGEVMRERVESCPVKRLSAAALEGAVIGFLGEVSRQPAMMARVMEATKTRAKGDRAALREELGQLEGPLGKVRVELARCVDAVVRGDAGALGPEVLERAENLRGEQAGLIVQVEKKRQELAACDTAAFDAQRVQVSLDRFTEILPRLSPEEQIELVRLFVERVEVKDPAKTPMGAALADGSARRVLALRIKLHLPQLVQGVEKEWREREGLSAAPCTAVTGTRGVFLDTSVDFSHAVKGEVTLLAPFQHAVRISDRARSRFQGETPKPEPQHLIVKAQAWRRMLENGHVANRVALAKREGVTPGAVTRILRMVSLVPEIQNFLVALKSREAIRHFGMKKVGALSTLPSEAQRVAFEKIRRAFSGIVPELVPGEALRKFSGNIAEKPKQSEAEQIIALLRKQGPSSPRTIAAAMNLSRATIYRQLSEMLSTGAVAVAGHTRSARYSA